MSTQPHANITVDYSEAVKMEGVAAYVGAQDVPGSNWIGKFRRTSVLWTSLIPPEDSTACAYYIHFVV